MHPKAACNIISVELTFRNTRHKHTINRSLPRQNNYNQLQTNISHLQVLKHRFYTVCTLCIFTETRLSLNRHSSIFGNFTQLISKIPVGEQAAELKLFVWCFLSALMWQAEFVQKNHIPPPINAFQPISVRSRFPFCSISIRISKTNLKQNISLEVNKANLLKITFRKGAFKIRKLIMQTRSTENH